MNSNLRAFKPRKSTRFCLMKIASTRVFHVSGSCEPSNRCLSMESGHSVSDSCCRRLTDVIFTDKPVYRELSDGEAHGHHFPEGLTNQLSSLASNWGDTIDMETLKIVRLSAGSWTNKIYRVSWPAKDENVRTVLLRIYGEGVDGSLDRDDETQKFVSISMLGLGPKLLAQFPEGRIEEFTHARTLSVGDLHDPEISGLLAAKLREFHNLDMPGSKKATFWDTIGLWISKARSTCTPEHVEEFRLEIIRDEIAMLESVLSKSHQDIGFCHNDLKHSNIMFDEETRKITIIDYEYVSYNPVACDLATLFFYMEAKFDTDTHNSYYPDLEERQRFIRLYLSSTGHQPSDAEVEKLVNDAEKYTPACYLAGGLWVLISYYGENNGLDGLTIARQMFEQFWLRKTLAFGTT